MGNYLQHHGIKGQRWYRRRFQNPDGSLTPEGKIRYANKAWDKLTNDEEAQRAMAKDATITTIAINGVYGGMSQSEKETYYRQMTENYRAGKLKIEAQFVRSYDDGSVICKVSDIPVGRLIIGRHDQLIRQINDDWLPAIQDYYDFLMREKESLGKLNVTNAKKGAPTQAQSKIANDIRSFEPRQPARKYRSEDEAIMDFNRQFNEKFGDVNLFDNEALMNAYDEQMFKFLDQAVS